MYTFILNQLLIYVKTSCGGATEVQVTSLVTGQVTEQVTLLSKVFLVILLDIMRYLCTFKFLMVS